MQEETYFSEIQRFNQWWIWLFLFVVNGFFLWAVYTQIYGDRSFGDHPMSNAGLLFSSIVMLILTLLFAFLRLETRIREDGIYVRFYPFHFKFRRYSWDQFTKVHVRTYSPIIEYGGWGLRIGFFKRGTAYNVSGNKGLQLEFKNRNPLLLGTQKPEELTKVLTQLGKII